MKILQGRIKPPNAVMYGIATRAVTLGVNLMTILLIARYLTLEAQGYFFAFRSFLTLQVFFELGLTTTLSTFFSHEFVHLRWKAQGAIDGPAAPKARCLEIFRKAAVVFRLASLGFIAIVSPVGWWFLARKGADISWGAPWLVAVAATAAFLYFTPHMALVMGSGEVDSVYRVWLIGALVGGGIAWVLLWRGQGLYAAGAANIGNSLAAMVFLVRCKRKLLRDPARGDASIFSWWHELWPMQWRLSVSWISGYFIYPMFVPVLFKFDGPALAGQMGMTLSLSNALLGVCLVIVNVENPRMGKMVAKREWVRLDHLYRRMLAGVTIVAILGVISGSAGVELMQAHGWGFAERILPWQVTGLILASVVITAYINAAGAYLRSHKVEPLMRQSVATALIQGSVIWWAGARFGAAGEAIGFFITSFIVVFPMIFLSRRYYQRLWHSPDVQSDIDEIDIGTGAGLGVAR